MPVSGVGAQSATPETNGLSVRSISELLEMKFSEEDLYVGDGILAKSQETALVGPPGIGKSRFLVQLAAASVLGKNFLGLPVRSRALTWLFLQAENGPRRLAQDIATLKSSHSVEELAQLQKHLHFHNLEREEDFMLNLDDHENRSRIAATIREYNPDVVVYDPINAFARSSLNSDACMLQTCRHMTSLARLDRPDAAVVYVHHATSGYDGLKKAVGPDRGAYARGSKALHARVRAQINLAQGDPADNSKILIACGKNSNGEEFKPIGAVLNRNSLTYELDPQFSLGDWMAAMTGKTATCRRKVSSAEVAEYVKDLPMKRNQLVKAIQDDHGCSKAAAYGYVQLAESSTIRLNNRKQYVAVASTKKTT